PAVRGLLQSAPHLFGVPVLINIPAFAIVMLITWLLLLGVRESATANNVLVIVKLVVLAIFMVARAMHLNRANYTPFAPNGFTGIHHGAAIVFFAYIGFDAISTAAEETKNPQRNLPIGILGGLAICTVIYIVVGAVLTGMVPSSDLGKAADPLAYVLVCIGVIVLRHTDPSRPRPFRTPFVHVVGILGALLCVFVMKGLPRLAWVRFGWWLVIGLAIYFVYGYRNSALGRTKM